MYQGDFLAGTVVKTSLGRPRGIGWGGRWEGGSGWGAHVNPWLIHVNVWQKPLQYCKVISLQLIKINEKKKKNISPSNAGDIGSIPGQGAYISHAPWLKNSNIIINWIKPKKAYHWPRNSTAKILPKGIFYKIVPYL